MDMRRDCETLCAVLCEIGWSSPESEAKAVHVVELKPTAPPVRDVVVALDEDEPALEVRVRFLPPSPHASTDRLVTALIRANGAIRAGAFALDDDDGSVFYRHTLFLGDRPLVADDVRRTVLTALETVAFHAVEIVQACTARPVTIAA
ncbi:hypothetical protein PO002_33600 [Cupriavidus necator]|uniref:hypothetical protein n=1 Tax=Cupriavidus necator TaxID=106590 RepID=UPI0039C3C229